MDLLIDVFNKVCNKMNIYYQSIVNKVNTVFIMYF